MDALDLDKLEPQPKQIVLGGKTYDLFPPKVRTILEIERFFVEARTNATPKETLERAVLICKNLIPAMKNDETIDLSIEQVLAIINYVYGMGSSDEKPKEGTEGGEKKDS